MRVLTVEDDRQRASALLGVPGGAPALEKLTTRRLEEAQAILSRQPADLVVLDLDAVPGDGQAAVQSLCRSGAVIVLAEAGQEHETAGLLQAGALDVLRPDEAASLGARLLRWVASWREGKAPGAAGPAPDDISTAMLQAMPEALLVLGGDGTVLQAAAAVERVFGLPAAALTGRKLVEQSYPPDALALANFLEGLRQSPGYALTAQYRFLHPDEQWRWVELVGGPAPAGAGSAMVLVCRDISARKRDELELGKLFNVVEHMGELAVITDYEGRIEYANPAFEQHTGYARAEVIGRRLSVLKSGEHPPEFYQRMWQTILAGNVFRGVLINRKRDGQLYYEDKIITPLKDADGRVTHFISTGRDITPRIQAEMALLESERRFQAVAELTSNYAYSLAVTPETTWEVLWVTDAFLEVTGYTMADLRALGGWEAMIYPADQVLYARRREQLRAGRPDVSEYRLVRRDGQVRWMRDYGRPEVDSRTGEVVRVLGAAQDITERKQAETTRAQLAAIVESSDEAIVSLHADGRIASWNAAAERLYGYSAAEAVGQSIELIVPPDRRPQLTEFLELLGRGESVPPHLNVRLRKDRRRIEVWMSCFPVKEASGQTAGGAFIARDAAV